MFFLFVLDVVAVSDSFVVDDVVVVIFVAAVVGVLVDVRLHLGVAVVDVFLCFFILVLVEVDPFCDAIVLVFVVVLVVGFVIFVVFVLVVFVVVVVVVVNVRLHLVVV